MSVLTNLKELGVLNSWALLYQTLLFSWQWVPSIHLLRLRFRTCSIPLDTQHTIGYIALTKRCCGWEFSACEKKKG